MKMKKPFSINYFFILNAFEVKESLFDVPHSCMSE